MKALSEEQIIEALNHDLIAELSAVEMYGAHAEAISEEAIVQGVRAILSVEEGHAHEFVCTQEGMLELCEAIGTGNVGLLLDSFHWYTSHGTKEDIHKLCDALLVDVHINDGVEGRGPDEQIDGERRLPGETGVIDLALFLQGLKEAGYTGPVTPEPFSEELRRLPAEDAIRKAAEAVLRVWGEAGI